MSTWKTILPVGSKKVPRPFCNSVPKHNLIFALIFTAIIQSSVSNRSSIMYPIRQFWLWNYNPSLILLNPGLLSYCQPRGLGLTHSFWYLGSEATKKNSKTPKKLALFRTFSARLGSAREIWARTHHYWLFIQILLQIKITDMGTFINNVPYQGW